MYNFKIYLKTARLKRKITTHSKDATKQLHSAEFNVNISIHAHIREEMSEVKNACKCWNTHKQQYKNS